MVKKEKQIEDDEILFLETVLNTRFLSSEDKMSFNQRREHSKKHQMSKKHNLKQIDAKLDLHGFTKDQARIELERFINSCRHSNMLSVLVITGKGTHSGRNKSILKEVVSLYLNSQIDKKVKNFLTDTDIQLLDNTTCSLQGSFWVRLIPIK